MKGSAETAIGLERIVELPNKQSRETLILIRQNF